MKPHLAALAVLVLTAIEPRMVHAQQTSASAPVDYETARFERRLTALRIEEAILLDGVLDEPAWQRAEIATHFVQLQPDTGSPASEDTEVRILYDDTRLYVGAYCHDSDVTRLTIKELKEDFAPNENDMLSVFLDTLNDDRSGFLFATNPAGAKHDVQSTQDGDQINVDWDGVWDVKVRVIEDGWIAEFAIPFKTLRFTGRDIQEWGLNFGRRIRRHNEETHWSPLPRRYRTLRASMAGTLEGLAGAKQGRNLKVKPFVIGGSSGVRTDGVLDMNGTWDGGLDVKYGVTPSLTLDLTYRTDFSQVEVDQQQVNLTRFNLFFPEKREFFIENAGLFSLAGTLNRNGGGGGGGGGNNSANLIPFFSRRIGLSPTGTPIPIVGGARMTGKVQKYDLGFITMRTERDGEVPANNFLVGRVARNLTTGSWVGALVTSRDSTTAGDYNRVYGVDANFRVREKLEISSYLLRSDTPGRAGNDQGRLFRARWQDDDFSFGGQYDEVQPNFNPEVGFVRRKDAAHYAADASWQPRFEQSRIVRNLIMRGNLDYFEDMQGVIETRTQTLRFGVDYQNGAISDFEYERTFDRLATPFQIRTDFAIPEGDYAYDRYSTVFNSDRSRVISGSINLEFGDFWDGHNTSVTTGLDLKPNYHFTAGLTLTRSEVELPYGSFDTTLIGVKALYAFTNRMFLNSFVQYNADTRQFSSNTRFNFIHRPLSDLFIVFNDRRDTVSGRLLERALIVKLTNLFDF